MNVHEFLTSAIKQALHPVYLDVRDESFMHSVPDGAQSHFKVTVVSDEFEGKRLIARHRQVNALADEALKGPVHALALHTYTPQEWEALGGQAANSPACLGGSKHD